MKTKFIALVPFLLLVLILPGQCGQKPSMNGRGITPKKSAPYNGGPAVASDVITIVTGDVEGAGTDAMVYMTLNSDQASSGEFEMTKPGADCFERNQWDDFDSYGNFGRITSIRLRHDNSNKKPGWYVYCVRVQHRASGLEDIFMIDRWLAADEGDKRIDITVPRSNVKTLTITAPYPRNYEWKQAPGAASAWTRAYKASGWFNFYADAFVGGSVAEAGHIAEFSANGAYPVAIRTTIIYVGGPINFGIASFSELKTTVNFNGSSSTTEIKAGFTGPIIKDKIKKVIALTDDDPNLGATFEEFTARMNEGQNYAKLSSAFETMEKSADAKRLYLCKTGQTKAGTNTVCSSMRTNSSAVLTGSSITIIGGIVKCVEVIGLPQ
jgi:hypothetical protein